MTSTIAAITTGGGGVVTTADASGNLSLLSGATTILAATATGVAVTGTLSATGGVTLTTPLPVASGGTGVATFTDAGVLIGNGTGAVQVTTAGTSGQVLTSNGAGVDPTFQATALKFIQEVTTQTGAVSTTATIIPLDDTIPQNTEGAEFMTLAITPTSATNNLRIDVTVFGGGTTSDAAGQVLIAALFQDTTASALAVGTASIAAGGLGPLGCTYSHIMAAGTTSSTTFKVRAGNNIGTFTFNGRASARLFGGVFVSSIRITEYKP